MKKKSMFKLVCCVAMSYGCGHCYNNVTKSSHIANIVTFRAK